MPDLPTVPVTQKQADRAAAAFGSVANYRAWARRAVAAEVLMIETASAAGGVRSSVAVDFPDEPPPA